MSHARRLALVLAFGIISPGLALASSNVEGISGILAIPTAEVVREGEVEFTVGRYLSDVLDPDQDWVARTYSATVGYLPGLEITARFVDYPGRPDTMGSTNYADRSVSAKYQLLAEEDWSLAFGATDIGGQSQRNDAFYGVVDYTGIEDWRFSLGGGTDKLEGVFGGVRYTPVDFLSLLSEYDTRQANYGVEVRPAPGLALKGGLVNDHPAFTASYTMPLDPRGQDTPCCPATLPRSTAEYGDECELAAAVRDALVYESFENVLVGVNQNTLFLEYESRRFREQLDALAVAAGLAIMHSSAEITRLVITPKIEDVPQLSLQADVSALEAFLASPGACPEGISVTTYAAGGCPPGTVYAVEGNKKPGGGDVFLRFIESFEITRPGEPTFASKTGLGLEEQAFLGRGLWLRARQDWPFHNDLTDKTNPVNRDAYLHYFDAWSPKLFVLLSGGYFGNEAYGGVAHAAYYFADGRYSMGGRYSYVRDDSNPQDSEDSMALGELAYYTPELDWELALLGGQFIEGDRGARIESTRYFGPTTLTFFAYDTDSSKPQGGFQFQIPMPWFSEGRHDAWRATGSPYFGYKYRTDSHRFGALAQAGLDLGQVRQRLRPEYVKAHLDDFRRALLLYSPACAPAATAGSP